MRPLAQCCAATSLAIAALCAPTAALAQYRTVNSTDWLRKAISTEARSHDFGSVARAAKTEHRFVITNPLDEAIHLRSVRASCGCTTPIIETQTIPPGGTGTILARFNTGTFTGNKSATLTVSIDKPFWTEIQLRVKGYIRSDIVINPGEANFGEVTKGEPKQLDLDLVYAGRNDWQLTKITSPNEFVKVDFEETGRGNGQVRYKIKATITDDAPVGDLHKQLVLHTNDRRITSVPLRLMANVRKDGIQTSVDNFRLGTVEEGQQVSKRLVIKAKEAFRILDISSDIIDVEFEPSDKPKAVHLVNINMKPNQRGGGKFDGSLFVKTDLEDEIAKLGLSFELASQHSVLKPATPIQVPVSKNEE